MPGFWRGVTYPFRGVAFLLGHRELWKYAAGAFLLNAVLFTGAALLFWNVLPDLVDLLTPDRAWSWVKTVVGVIVGLAAFLLGLFLYTIVGNLVAGPFLDAMTERMLTTLGVPLPPGRGIASAIGRSVANQLLKLVLFGTIQVLLLALLLTPLGFLHPPLAGLLTVLFLALEFADYPLDARRVPVPSRLAWAFRHARPAFGFGAACLALSFVPFLLYFLLPSAVAGAVLLVRDIDAARGNP